ncbi:hypothetical protein CCH79_00017663 [Gambusia affinis]|uniref:Uncharacterized protein n=1 Tax=Gambusia affinis TaxID=33528 RepID=A0A315W3M2_GAMAF|nr:hypothetical protein CCH79_00017663 [Gambusia affinis]
MTHHSPKKAESDCGADVTGLFSNRWLARLWNAVVVPRVEGAVISRMTTKRSTSSSSQRPSPSNCGLSTGQQAVLRRSNTSPRKKGSPSVTWSSGGSFREGSVSSSDVRFMSNGHRQPAGLPVFFDDETDLIRELQTMCSSRSEPDISQISQVKDSLILFPRTPSKEQPGHKTNQEAAVQQQSETGKGFSIFSSNPAAPPPFPLTFSVPLRAQTFDHLQEAAAS